MSNHPHTNMPAGKVLSRAVYLTIAMALILAVGFVLSGDRAMAALMVIVSSSCVISYSEYKRRLAARDAPAEKLETPVEA